MKNKQLYSTLPVKVQYMHVPYLAYIFIRISNRALSAYLMFATNWGSFINDQQFFCNKAHTRILTPAPALLTP